MILEVTPQDIAKLNDEDLRTLIGKLCIAELESAGESGKGVIFGGNQDAPDGGVDVRVERSSSFRDDHAYVPRPHTIFQVKKPDMTASAIIKEMKPHGKLRDTICEMEQCDGAYIMVSSGSNCTNSMLLYRGNAMRNCLGGLSGNIFVDFYDRSRIAAWAEKHPSVIIWLYGRLQHPPMRGWRPYDEWSGNRTPKFFYDESVRIKKRLSDDDSDADTVEQSINKIRSLLAKPKSAIRLTGLSGVGKTRLLQALFDETIGVDALDKSLAIYTDVGQEPDPTPVHLAEELVICGKRGVLLIDNCPPETHTELVKVCNQDDSCLSCITVEYDVRDSLSEETDVFYMEPASEAVIKLILKARWPDMPDNDVCAIANYSGGNARIALALAETYKPGITYAGLTDSLLMERLLFQTEPPDKELRQNAHVLSLVYSFKAEYGGEENNELAVLAKIAEVSSTNLYRFISDLCKRQLIQSRGPWRALMPHVFANRLADNAVAEFPAGYLMGIFTSNGNERLFKSFAHRLGYLHDNKDAAAIVKNIITYIKELGYPDVDVYLHEIVCYLAPADPGLILNMVYTAIINGRVGGIPEHIRSRYVTMIAQIGYEEVFFEHAARVLIELARVDRCQSNNYARNILIDYFQLRLSGTCAAPEVRLKLIKELIGADDEYYKKLGMEALKQSLRCGGFMGGTTCGMPFGMRSRDYGYWPTGMQIMKWYEIFVDYACELIVEGGEEAKYIKGILATCSGGICNNSGLFSIVEKAADRIIQATSWDEGWLALNGRLCRKTHTINEPLRSRIALVCEKLAPKKLSEKIRACVLVRGVHVREIAYSIDPSSAENYEGQAEIASNYIRSLGRELASDAAEFKEIFPELYSNDTNSEYLTILGKGFAEESSNPLEHWKQMLQELQRQNEDVYCASFMSGVLSQLFVRDPVLASTIADDLASWPYMKNNALYILANADMSADCHRRIMQLLRENPGVNWSYTVFPRNKLYEKAEYSLEFAEELIKQNCSISSLLWQVECDLPDGSNKKSKWESHRIRLLNMMDMCVTGLSNTSQIDAEPIQRIIKYASTAENAERTLAQMAQHLCERILISTALPDEFERAIARSIAQANPPALLDAFLKDGIELDWKYELLLSGGIHDKCCLEGCDVRKIMEWVDKNPAERLEKIANIVDLFETNNSKVIINNLARRIIDSPYVTKTAIQNLTSNFGSFSFTGEQSDALIERREIVAQFTSHENEVVRNAVAERLTEIDARILREQERERQERERGHNLFEP